MKAVEKQKSGRSATIKYLLVMLVIVSVLNPAKLPPTGWLLEKSTWPSSPVEERQNFNALNSGVDTRHLMKLAANVNTEESVLVSGTDTSTEALEANENLGTQISLITSEKTAEIKSFAESRTIQPSVSPDQRQDKASSHTDTDSLATKSSMMCEFSNYRYNMCSIEANLKVIGNSLTVLIIPSSPVTPVNTTVWKIRPFTRKWEEETMSTVREVTIRWSSDQNHGPECDVTHDVPVLIFATAGFRFNPFHDFSDLLIPLFVAAKQYNGKIQFAATNFDWPWINKYLPHLQALSHYPIINLDSETQVHCFPSGQVGLRGNGPLSVESSSVQSGYYTTQQFRHFLRTSLSLKRAQVKIIEKNSNRKPKIAILLRQWTRTFTNENEIIEMAEKVGFEVIRADTETTKDFPRIAHMINACDALMGVHGAGLTNMMYLPNNATVIQINPWGETGDLGIVSWKDYGEPTKNMGLNYVGYDIKAEESTLIEKYPRNHTVFTNPQEIHKQGWRTMYTIFLVDQSVKLDVNRFSGVLMDLFNSLTQ